MQTISDLLSSGRRPSWTRRAWLTQNLVTVAMSVPVSRLLLPRSLVSRTENATNPVGSPAFYDTAELLNNWQLLAERAVDAARRAGAQYAEAQLTRTEHHRYGFGEDNGVGEELTVGFGVRALVNGYWGFSARPSGDLRTAEMLGKRAVSQAAVNARSVVSRTVDLGTTPVAVGHWKTPVQIDPFTITIEEKHAFMRYWEASARKARLMIDPGNSHLRFVRQDRVSATSEGGRFTQSVYESGGEITVMAWDHPKRNDSWSTVMVAGIERAGRGWEMFLDAKIQEQFRSMPEQMEAFAAINATANAGTVGRYTLVCDGATMARLVSCTIGVATQLDRALGYEANASGTSFLDDPMAMVGTFNVASPLVTITANRSAPTQLATVKWDDEGVEPQPFTLVREGILTDFQTTREQAAWLAPYYSAHGHTVRSHGCAASSDALSVTMQHIPNLSFEPRATTSAAVGARADSVEDLIADVKDGLFVEQGGIAQMDSQAKNGLLMGQFRKITNGKLGIMKTGLSVQFNTLDFWRRISAVGGPGSQVVVPFSQFPTTWDESGAKGDPRQRTSYSVQAVAATIPNQALIDINRRA